MDFFRNLSQQLRQIWLGMPRSQQVVVTVVVTATVALLAGVIYWTTQTEYQVLHSGLSAEDAGAITAKLQAKGVPFKLTSGGTTIMVPTEQLQQVRIELAAEDLPGKGSPGFGLFDQNSFGSTPFTQRVTFQRALQGELAKTIMQIDPVVSARVHIVRPEQSPFLREQKPTTASVMLKLRPGTTLSRGVSAGI